jgi:ribosomal protein L37AE/L43A
MRECDTCHRQTNDISGTTCWQCEQFEIDAMMGDDYGMMTGAEAIGEMMAAQYDELGVYDGMYSEM